MTTPDALSALAACLPTVRTRMLSYRDRLVRLTETDTIRVLVLPVLEALGRDLQDVEEVRSEYRHGVADNHVDYALFLRSTPPLFVGSKPLIQKLNYVNAAGTDRCALTSGVTWQIYNVHEPVEAERELFMTVLLGGPAATIEVIVAKVSLLSRGRMQARAIDALCTEWLVDGQLAAVLDTITENEAFGRLDFKLATGSTASAIRVSLRRSEPRNSHPRVAALMVTLEGIAALRHDGGCAMCYEKIPTC